MCAEFIADLSGLSLQSGPSRVVKDEYSVAPGAIEVDQEQSTTVQHHAPPPQQIQYHPHTIQGKSDCHINGITSDNLSRSR